MMYLSYNYLQWKTLRKKQNQHSVYNTSSLAQDSHPSSTICLQDFLSIISTSSETCNKSFFQVLIMSPHELRFSISKMLWQEVPQGYYFLVEKHHMTVAFSLSPSNPGLKSPCPLNLFFFFHRNHSNYLIILWLPFSETPSFPFCIFCEVRSVHSTPSETMTKLTLWCNYVFCSVFWTFPSHF